MASHRDVLAEASRRLAAGGVADASRDARLLLQHAGGLDHAGLIARLPDALGGEARGRYEAMLRRRLAGEPVTRIVGWREFRGLCFAVTPDVLDPRPETEILVERVLADHGGRSPFFADIGTGSGAIAVALLAALPGARCVASDVSAAALGVASANAVANGVAGRAEFVCRDMLDGHCGPYDFIVSNPPYVESGAIAGLAPEVARHDPRLALDGGRDGLDAYRALLDGAASRLVSGGRLYLEIGSRQAGPVASLAAERGWRVADVAADLAGLDRVVVVVRQ